MELNDRKIRILEYIINDYIATAEPVGSRTIAKKHDIGLSSATIRNEMSDLEEMGYILAPHASAGRVPSDKGYRLFVDRLLRRLAQGGANRGKDPGPEMDIGVEGIRFLERIIARNINQIDYLMQETAKAISVLTNYTAVVSGAAAHKKNGERLARLQLIPLDESSVLLVTVTASKKVKNSSIRLNSPPDYEELESLSRALNLEIAEWGEGDIRSGSLNRLKKAFTGHEQLLDAVISAARNATETLQDGAGKQVYTSGIKNILDFPEFYDHTKARAVFEALEERDYLVRILEGDSHGISVIIGQENIVIPLRDCSVVRAPYSLDEDVHGSIAVIGPTRMDYSQTVSVIQSMVKHLSGALRALESWDGKT